MKLWAVLSKANNILNNILNYLPRRRKGRLYQQWVKRAGLPREAIPHEEIAEDIIPKIDKEQLRRYALYILLGASLVILAVGLILLIVHSC